MSAVMYRYIYCYESLGIYPNYYGGWTNNCTYIDRCMFHPSTFSHSYYVIACSSFTISIIILRMCSARLKLSATFTVYTVETVSSNAIVYIRILLLTVVPYTGRLIPALVYNFCEYGSKMLLGLSATVKLSLNIDIQLNRVNVLLVRIAGVYTALLK